MDGTAIEIRGATENNLKEIDVDIPRQAITVVSGVSGAGKTSLVFGVIFKEAQRRYLNTMSLYTRKLLQEFSTTKVKSIRSLSPALALLPGTMEQATVGEVTGLEELWRILLVANGDRSCPEHRLPTSGQPPTTIVDNLLEKYQGQTVIIAAPIPADASLSKLRAKYLRIVNGATRYSLDELESLPAGDNSVVIDALKVRTRTRLLRTVEQCLTVGNGCGQLLADKDDLTVVNYFSSVASCPRCGFSWPEVDTHSPLLDQYPQAISIGGKSLAEIRKMPIETLYKLATTIRVPVHLQRVVQAIRTTLLRLQELGLDYLTLDRTSLATGERQKIRIVSLLNENLNGVIYLFDEPSCGLATEELNCLWQLFVTLKEQGNTVIIVDHQPLFFKRADWLIELGPAAGVDGGQLLAKFKPSACGDYQDRSPTARSLANDLSEQLTVGNSSDQSFFSIIQPQTNNLRLGRADFAQRAITVVSGVSGSGKSTLVNCLYRSLRDGCPHGCRTVEGANDFAKTMFVDRSPLPSKGQGMIVNQLGIFSWLRQLFSQLRDSQLRGLRANDFALRNGKGRCQYCQGRGRVKAQLPYLPATLCTVCNGRRYNQTVEQITYRQLNIGSVLELSIAEAEKFFANFKKIVEVLTTARELGLGYLGLGRPTSELSGGEWQRLKLVPVVAKATSNSLVILDQPAGGLHHADILPLMRLLDKLTTIGVTIVVVEHNPLVVANSSWQIELGPGGGPYGGQLLYCGRPKSRPASNAAI